MKNLSIVTQGIEGRKLNKKTVGYVETIFSLDCDYIVCDNFIGQGN